MTAHNVIALDVSVPQAVVPQSGDTYNFPRDATFAGDVAVQGAGLTLSQSGQIFTIAHTVNDRYIEISGGTSITQGGGIRFYGETTASGAKDIIIYSSGDSKLQYDDSAGQWEFKVPVRFEGSADAEIANGNLVIGTSGKGIDYTAAGGSVLDQYKEGTFTASLNGSGGGTAVNSTARYTKTGDVYHVEVEFSNVDTTGMSGNIQVTGFPEASSGNAFGSAWSNNIAGSSIANGFIPRLSIGTTVNFLTNDSLSQVTISAGTGRYLRFTIDYKV